MTVVGAAYSPWLFWDGRKDSLWAQALGPLESPVEHGGTRTQYAHLIDRYYRSDYEALFGPPMPPSPFHHIALKVDRETQQGIEQRVAAAGYKEPHTYVLEHGYCRSVYVTDPNGLILEFTLDHPEADKISRDRRADAHRELKRWLEGNHKSNNTYR